MKGDFGKASVGEKSNALRVGSSSTIYFEPGVQNLWLHAMGTGNLGINDIKASGLVDIVGDDAVTVGLNGQAGGIKGSSVTVSTQKDLAVNGKIASASEARLASETGSVSVEGNVAGTSVDLDAAGGGISVNGNVESTAESGQVTLDAANDVSVTGNVTGKGQVALTAGNGASIDGSVRSENNTVTILARDGGITIGEKAAGSISGTSVDLNAAHGDISVNGNVKSTDVNGRVTLDSTESISVVGDIASNGLITLTAGSNA